MFISTKILILSYRNYGPGIYGATTVTQDDIDSKFTIEQKEMKVEAPRNKEAICEKAFEMWCWRNILGVSWKERRTNESVLNHLYWLIGSELIPKVALLRRPYFGDLTHDTTGWLT